MHKKKWQQTLTSLSICRSIPRDFSMSLLFLCFLSSLLMVFSCLTSLCLLLCLSRARIWALGGLNTPLLLPIIFGWSFAVGTYWPMKKIPKIIFQVEVKFRLFMCTSSSIIQSNISSKFYWINGHFGNIWCTKF